jgi:2,4-dichlorophenol 6-monooxygenase
MFTFRNRDVTDAAMGFIPGNREHNINRIHELIDDNDLAKSYRAHLQRNFDSQAIEVDHLALELGFDYEDGGAWIADGSRRERDPLNCKYKQTTRPGHRLPHAWLTLRSDVTNKLLSTHDLIGHNEDYLLMTDVYGSTWVEAAHKAAKSANISIKVAQITSQVCGVRMSEYIDVQGEWEALSELDRGGPILVRPDNFIAWRSKSRSPDTDGKVLLEAIMTLLCK